VYLSQKISVQKWLQSAPIILFGVRIKIRKSERTRNLGKS